MSSVIPRIGYYNAFFALLSSLFPLIGQKQNEHKHFFSAQFTSKF